MSSANSYVTGTAWRRLLEAKQDRFEESGFQIFAVEQDEERFREYFEPLCLKLQEPYYTNLLVKLRFHRVNEIANVLDDIDQLIPPLNFVTLVWASAFTVIQVGANSRKNLAESVALVGRLNSSIPRIRASEARRFPYDNNLRAPLYLMLDRYADTLLLIILHIQAARSGHSLNLAESVENKLREAAELFKAESEYFKQLIDRAVPTDGQHNSSGFSPHSGNPEHENTARFQVGKWLGRGSGGEVYEVKEMTTGDVYARKQIRLTGNPSADENRIRQVKHEVDMMKLLNHIHIASIAFWLKEPSACSIFMTPRADFNLWNFLEKCSTSGYASDDLRSIVSWFGCLLQALCFAHVQSIAHCDIKPSNILVKSGRVYLADFGEAKDTLEAENSRTENDHVRGTPVYRAPEVRSGYRSQLPADIFSLGCVFSEMLTILANRSMKEYQDFRRAPQADPELAFRANLPKVRDWLKALDVEDKVYDPMVYLIKRMIPEAPGDRWTAVRLRDRLVDESKDVKFSCGYH